jgi:MFS family permease
MLPILNHIIYSFVILIATAYILHENMKDKKTKEFIYNGILLGSAILIFLVGILASKIFIGRENMVLYLSCILFAGITSYFVFINKQLSENMISIFIAVTLFLVGICIGKIFNLTEDKENNLISVLGSHYGYILIIISIIAGYFINMYYKNKKMDPEYKCNLKTICVSSVVAFIIILINFLIYYNHDAIPHKVEFKYEL